MTLAGLMAAFAGLAPSLCLHVEEPDPAGRLKRIRFVDQDVLARTAIVAADLAGLDATWHEGPGIQSFGEIQSGTGRHVT